MEMNEIIRAVMKYKSIKGTEMAKELGLSHQTVRNILHRGNMSLYTANRMAEVLDCDVVLRDRKTGEIYD